jgi:hypothetical protein
VPGRATARAGAPADARAAGALCHGRRARHAGRAPGVPDDAALPRCDALRCGANLAPAGMSSEGRVRRRAVEEAAAPARAAGPRTVPHLRPPRASPSRAPFDANAAGGTATPAHPPTHYRWMRPLAEVAPAARRHRAGRRLRHGCGHRGRGLGAPRLGLRPQPGYDRAGAPTRDTGGARRPASASWRTRLPRALRPVLNSGAIPGARPAGVPRAARGPVARRAIGDINRSRAVSGAAAAATRCCRCASQRFAARRGRAPGRARLAHEGAATTSSPSPCPRSWRWPSAQARRLGLRARPWPPIARPATRPRAHAPAASTRGSRAPKAPRA